MPQQRTSAVRRVRPNFFGAQFQTVDWLPAAFLGTAVRFSLSFAGTGIQDTTRDYSLNGIPQMSWLDLSTFPISAAWEKPYLVLDWGVPVDDSQPFVIAANDPAFRGPKGEYLVGKVIAGVPAPPAPHDTVISFGNADVAVATFAFSDGSDLLFLSGLDSIQNTTKGEAAIDYTTAAGGCTVTFPTPPDVGDQIDFTGGAASFLNQSGGTLLATSVILA
jgi:hypothetical protein